MLMVPVPLLLMLLVVLDSWTPISKLPVLLPPVPVKIIAPPPPVIKPLL